MKNNKKDRIRGQKALESGQLLEKLLIEEFELYKKTDIAYINKLVDEEHIRKLEQMYLGYTYKKVLRVDFIGYTRGYNGHYIPKPTFVAIEAKQTLKNYLPFQMIRQHQLEYLFQVFKSGGISFFVIGFPLEKKIIRLWVTEEIYFLINGKLTHTGAFSQGIDFEMLCNKVNKNDIYTYDNPDILGLFKNNID